MSQLQTFLHQLEEGAGKRFFRIGILSIALLLLVFNYNHGAFKNMSNPESMDSAQLARNIATGKGYTTSFIRPLSVYLVKRTQDAKTKSGSLDVVTDPGLLNTGHPDLANPPVYPLVLATMMKILPGMAYQTAGNATLNIGEIHLEPWNRSNHFWIYGPDFWISLFNQFLMLMATILVFKIARSLFDSLVAWTSAGLFIGTDLYWRLSISGLSTMLVIVIFLALAWCLLHLERRDREATEDAMFCRNRQLLMAGAIGALTGIGCLTRYSFGWLIIPVVLYLLSCLGRHKFVVSAATVAAFLIVIGPWVARNYNLSHSMFGTAGYSPIATTPFFPDYKLERSLKPDFGPVTENQMWNKLSTNAGSILEEALPRMGGNWIGAFFLVGLLIRFQNPGLNRLRYFLLGCIAMLTVVQALGQTQLSVDKPEINSENLLVFAAPLVSIFGVSLFYSLLDQITTEAGYRRNFLISIFTLLMCLPAIASVVGPQSVAIAYPPYYPPMIQKAANWMNEDELMMSDVPWAVAWYGNRPCVWLTVSAQSEFQEFHKKYKAINALYLTPVTMDAKFLTQNVWAGENTWGSVALNILFKGELPENFPLVKAENEYPPEQMFLSDTARWLKPAPAKSPDSKSVK